VQIRADAVRRFTDHPEGAEPWTHHCAEGYADALKIRVVICHIPPPPQRGPNPAACAVPPTTSGFPSRGGGRFGVGGRSADPT